MKKILVLLLLSLAWPTIIHATNLIELNTASLQQLDTLAGVGPALAQRIVDGRPYSSIDDLSRVKGIGEKILQDIKSQGLAYVLGQLQLQVQKPIEMTKTHPAGIFINEVLPAPEGTDEVGEWIELQNTSNTEVDISNWKLQDIEGTVTTYTFTKNTKLPAKGYLVLARPDTKITLNNDIDGVQLLFPDRTLADSMHFEKALKGQSYNKTNNSWAWSKNPTPGATNSIITTTASVKPLPKAKKSGNKVNVAPASISEPTQNIFNGNLNQESNSSSPWFLFLIAIGLTTVAGAMVLLTKFIVYKNHVRS